MRVEGAEIEGVGLDMERDGVGISGVKVGKVEGV